MEDRITSSFLSNGSKKADNGGEMQIKFVATAITIQWADRGFVPSPVGFLQTYLIWKSII